MPQGFSFPCGLLRRPEGAGRMILCRVAACCAPYCDCRAQGCGCFARCRFFFIRGSRARIAVPALRSCLPYPCLRLPLTGRSKRRPYPNAETGAALPCGILRRASASVTLLCRMPVFCIRGSRARIAVPLLRSCLPHPMFLFTSHGAQQAAPLHNCGDRGSIAMRHPSRSVCFREFALSDAGFSYSGKAKRNRHEEDTR